jgi:heme A synthase
LSFGAIHSVWGYVAVGLCGLTGIWGLILSRKPASPRPFKAVMTVAVAAVLLQVLLGVLAITLNDSTAGNQHVFYGIVISFTLAFAYIYRVQLAKRQNLSYGLLLLFVMGLGIRGIMTFGKSFGG